MLKPRKKQFQEKNKVTFRQKNCFGINPISGKKQFLLYENLCFFLEAASKMSGKSCAFLWSKNSFFPEITICGEWGLMVLNLKKCPSYLLLHLNSSCIILHFNYFLYFLNIKWILCSKNVTLSLTKIMFCFLNNLLSLLLLPNLEVKTKFLLPCQALCIV